MDFIVRTWGNIAGSEFPMRDRARFAELDEAYHWARERSQGSLLTWEVYQESLHFIRHAFYGGKAFDLVPQYPNSGGNVNDQTPEMPCL